LNLPDVVMRLNEMKGSGRLIIGLSSGVNDF